jgi:hypothetical protein
MNGNFSIRGDFLGKPLYIFTIGSEQKALTNFDFTFISAGTQHIMTNVEAQRGAIPQHSDTPVAILLLYFEVKDRPLIKQLMLSPIKINNKWEYEPKIINDGIAKIIKPHVVDAVLYGSKCSVDQFNEFKRYIPKLSGDCKKNLVVSPNYDALNPEKMSFSRCFEDNSAIRAEEFLIPPETPGERNVCIPTLSYPFHFQGAGLQRTAQKMLINCWTTLSLAQRYPSILVGGPKTVAARLLGVRPATLSAVSTRYVQTGSLQTPKRKRFPNRKLITFDSFDNDMTRRIIKDSYAANKVLTFDEIYTKFMQTKADAREQQVEAKRINPARPEPDPVFTCSKQTFRKYVKILGYKYGKIDGRAAVIQRPEIVQWRGHYLRKLRTNRNDPNPKKLVYLGTSAKTI